jgi:ubiquinone/menaquinone biosynthesis C-methylase UbiE
MNAFFTKYTMPTDVVMKMYSNADVIKKYLSVGLWNSEEILVDRYFKPKGRVLDIGCGAGRTTIALAKKGFHVTGIDLVSEMVEAAKKQATKHDVNVDFFAMNASALKFPDTFFQNALFSFNGIEHIHKKEQREKVIPEVCRILKPRGIFILTARSGFAFGKRWIGWIWMFFRHYILNKIGLGNQNLDMGDMVFKGDYHHYLSPFKIRKDLEENGFDLVFFNSHGNIQNYKKSSFFTNFSNDKCLFFVARKII